MKSTRFLASTLALLLCASLAVAQQGEGTGGDFVMTTQVNGGGHSTADKTAAELDFLDIAISSPLGSASGQGFILVGDVRPVTEEYEELGVVGLHSATRFVVYDSVFGAAFGIKVPPAGNTLNLGAVIPQSPLWFSVPNNGLWLQCAGIAIGSGTALFGAYEISETIKHEVGAATIFSDDCYGAMLGAGLSDADLGIPFTVNTTQFTNNVTTSGLSGFGTQTNFMVQPAGMGSGSSNGTGPDAFVRFTATTGGRYTFDFCASMYDTRVWLMPVTCNLPVAGIVHNDDASGDPGFACVPATAFTLVSRLREICLTAGQSVLLVIDGFSGSAGVANFVITKAPEGLEVTSVTPAVVGSLCGTPPATININGNDFVAGATVTIDGFPMNVVSMSAPNCGFSNLITIDNPQLPEGTYDVVVTNPDLTSSILVGGVTFANLNVTTVPRGDDVVAIHNLCNPVTFYGTTHTQVRISTNGRIVFGTVGADQWSSSYANMRANSPSISLAWTDLNSAIGTSPNASIVLTETAAGFDAAFSEVRHRDVPGAFVTGVIGFDNATGTIELTYGTTNGTLSTPTTFSPGCVAGISPGNNLFPLTPAIPEIDFTATASFTAATALDPVFEAFYGVADPVDLDGMSFTFTPLGGVGIGPYEFTNP